MNDVNAYCDLSYKRLSDLKAGLDTIVSKTEALEDDVHAGVVNTLKGLVSTIETGIQELKTQCPSDWSPNKKDLDSLMKELSKTLSHLADRADIALPDTTAWV